MDSSNSQGVYFLANDVIADWSVAFLESFRAFNPDSRANERMIVAGLVLGLGLAAMGCLWMCDSAVRLSADQ